MFLITYALAGGIATGAMYGLIALGFVTIYKASKVMNFATGEFVTLGGFIVLMGYHLFDMGIPGSIVLAMAGMVVLAVFVNDYLLKHLFARPAIVLIMVTIGLGAFLRAFAAIFLRAPLKEDELRMVLPMPEDPMWMVLSGLSFAQIINAVLAIVCIGLVYLFFSRTRTGIALRALAEDQQVAMSMGIDLQTHFIISWAIAGIVSVVAGVLWGNYYGYGMGLVTLGLKVFPVVVIGGLESIPGVLLGGMFIGLAETFVSVYADPIVAGGSTREFTPYIIMIIFLVIRPYGIFGEKSIDRV